MLSLCTRGLLRAAVSQPILLEAERNIRSKLRPESLDAFYVLLAVVPMMVVQIPVGRDLEQFSALVGEKDEHVLAAAIQGEVDFVVTLDQALEARINRAAFPVQAFSPGGFIKTILVDHPAYGELR